jgi:diguanylate cyclase (GGDEF)-like protein
LRDEQAARRDRDAAARDRAAEERDRELNGFEHSARAPLSFERLLTVARKSRAGAMADRAAAADDRRLAARDRERAAQERAEAVEALRGAHFDDLTGAHRRGFGEEVLRDEIERARRSDGRLALAVVDVDGLKKVNDQHGHYAGDVLLCDLVEAIRANIRSYEPIVRLGGDEFAFAMLGFDAEGLRDRCTVIKADLARRPSAGSITIGITELRPGDDLRDLFRRADQALVAARTRPAGVQGALPG